MRGPTNRSWPWRPWRECCRTCNGGVARKLEEFEARSMIFHYGRGSLRRNFLVWLSLSCPEGIGHLSDGELSSAKNSRKNFPRRATKRRVNPPQTLNNKRVFRIHQVDSKILLGETCQVCVGHLRCAGTGIFGPPKLGLWGVKKSQKKCKKTQKTYIGEALSNGSNSAIGHQVGS